ncbi:efflux RND transporter permease subunit [Chengkuizengella axinellae]|uniref:Efflux RND transporter permease subunit n=1 Tax=Chengkuizengella axinellae TaxID=3064388 RepID=A0ABT9IYS2_9BACL|nr:efflux RND transporter permease subunit [Chengkuizengella sp. 2205SS18-9]MDP5274510.1 efflux RND transporter permease subunit [Chengkuizengella sp. 2205SS18-9]
MHLIKTAVQRPVSVIMLVICVLIIGTISLRNIPIDLFPEVEVNVVTVQASYSGVSPQEMEKLVTRPLEEQIASLNGVESINSQSSSGVSFILIEFGTDIELDQAVTDLQEKINKANLPDDVDTPNVLKFDINSQPIIYLGLTGKDTTTLESIADDISANFEKLEGVASVDITGGTDREIQVTLNPILLEQYNLTATDVVNAIRNKNTASTVGEVLQGDTEVQVRVDGEYDTLDEIRNTAISLQDGTTITVEDVGDLEDTVSDVQSQSNINSEPAVILSISKQSGTNTIAITDLIHEEIANIQKDLGEGVELEVVFDTSTFIRDSISGVVLSLLAGGFFAILVLLFFLRSIRATAVIALSIPFAIISTFILVDRFDQTLNIITLSGLALGIGMMVDSSIVILENIVKYRQNGMDAKEAAIKGGSELISAVIASTTTTVVVFVPMMIIDAGILSQIFLPLAMVVAFALLAALLVSLTLVPMLAAGFLKTNVHEKLAKEARWLQFINNVYNKLLRWSLRRRWIVVLLTFVIIIGSLFSISLLNITTFPTSGQNQIQLSANFDDGVEFDVVQDYGNQIDGILRKYEDNIEMQYTEISATNITTFLLLYDEGDREINNEDISKAIQDDLDASIVGIEVKAVQQTSTVGGTDSDITVTISGPEQDVLETLTDQVDLLLSGIPALENVEVPGLSGQPQLTVTVDDELAGQYNLSQGQIMAQLNETFKGSTATKFRENGDEFDVVVQLPESERETIESLNAFLLTTPTGGHVPLISVATVEQTLGPVSIQRVDQKQEYSVTADMVEGADVRQATAEVDQVLSQIPVPKGYEVTTGGIQMDFNESAVDLLLILALAIFLVYTVMAVQFESFSYPFIVMFSLPTTVVGVIFGLLVTGTELSFPALIGLIVLAGIVVNNAIVLIDYVNQLKRKGTERNEAIIEAGKSRLRPILMTSFTTALGMLPIAMGIGEGSETQQPIGVVVIFGLLFSMAFTLLLIPVIYTIVDDVSRKFTSIFSRKNKNTEPKDPTVVSS